MKKKFLSIGLAISLVLSCIPVMPALAWDTSRTEPMPITDQSYMWPAFSNGEVLLNKKQGRLPALGWNSWNAFGSGNTEALTKAQADKFIELGLDKVGYEYIVLDDGCYNSSRDENGKLTNNTTRFPSGFKAMSDYMHERGLKFGMYNDIGTNLCAGAAVGTVGFEDLDAQTYTDWGVDFLKVDNCYYLWDNATASPGANVQYAYAPRIRSITVSGDGLNQTINAVNGGTLLGSGASKVTNNNYVEYIGTADGTGTGRDMANPTWAELGFNVNAPSDGTYDLVVEYASGTVNGCGRWLQVAVGPKETEKRFFDNALTATTNNTTFINSDVIQIDLKKGDNLIRLMNHRRQENTLQSYSALLDGMNKANKDNPNYDFLLSICEWGKTQPHEWGYKVGNSWRVLNDITFSVGNPNGGTGSGSWNAGGTASICSQYNKAVIQDEYAGLDKGWNDPDMMVIGMSGITTKMSETHMTMWSMMNSPIMLGLDLRRVTKGDDLWNIIANPDVIALNQDPLGIQAKRIYSSATGAGRKPDEQYITNNSRIDVLAKPLANGDIALSFFNLNASEAASASVDMDLILDYIGNKMVNADDFQKSPLFFIKDVWTKEIAVTGRTFSVTDLPGTDNKTIIVSTCDDANLAKDFLWNLIGKARTELEAKTAPVFPTPINAANSALNSAINDALAVYNNSGSTIDMISASINALTDKLQSFKDDYDTLDALKSALNMAAVVFENAAKYVKDDNWNAFVTKENEARGVYESRISVAQIVTATNELLAARGKIKRILGESFDPIAWYIFDNPTTNIVNDESGNGKHGTLLDGAKILPGNELRFEGTGYVQLPAGMLSGETEFTLATWVKHYSYNNWARLFDFGMSSTNGYMFVCPSNGSGLLGYAITAASNNAEQGMTATRPAVNEWMHLVVTQEGTTVRMYLNGVQVASRTNTTLNPSNAIKEATSCYIGKSQWSDPYLNSSIKDVRIYDKPLTVEQINQIMLDFKPSIADIEPVTITAKVGVAPTLPSQVNVKLDDGSASSVSVIWDEYDPINIFIGKTFTVSGTIVNTDAITNPNNKKTEAIISFDLNSDFAITTELHDDPAEPYVDYFISNIGDKNDIARLVYAIYDKEDGRLIKSDMKTEPLSPDSYISGKFDIVLPVGVNINDLIVKVFLWDSKYVPLMLPLEIKSYIEPVWSVVRPNNANMTLNSNQSITIRTESGDLWGKTDGNGTAKNICLMDVPSAEKDKFSVTVKVSDFKPNQNYQRAALIVYTGDGNQVSVMRRYHNGQGNNVFQTTMNTNGSAGSESQYTADTYGNECLLRLDKDGANISGYFSVDNGVTWNPILPTRTQNNINNAADIKIGFYASNGDQTADSVPVTFEDFTFNGKAVRFSE